jgi:hypothetical protein
MRTTVTLDGDVEALLRVAMRERHLSFKEAVNNALRAGLTPAVQEKSAFTQKVFAMGAEPAFRWDKALAAADALEDEEYGPDLSGHFPARKRWALRRP